MAAMCCPSAQPRLSRLLLVDDDAATRDGYAAYLTGVGYDVLSAASIGHYIDLSSAVGGILLMTGAAVLRV